LHKKQSSLNAHNKYFIFLYLHVFVARVVFAKGHSVRPSHGDSHLNSSRLYMYDRVCRFLMLNFVVVSLRVTPPPMSGLKRCTSCQNGNL